MVTVLLRSSFGALGYFHHLPHNIMQHLGASYLHLYITINIINLYIQVTGIFAPDEVQTHRNKYFQVLASAWFQIKQRATKESCTVRGR